MQRITTARGLIEHGPMTAPIGPVEWTSFGTNTIVGRRDSGVRVRVHNRWPNEANSHEFRHWLTMPDSLAGLVGSDESARSGDEYALVVGAQEGGAPWWAALWALWEVDPSKIDQREGFVRVSPRYAGRAILKTFDYLQPSLWEAPPAQAVQLDTLDMIYETLTRWDESMTMRPKAHITAYLNMTLRSRQAAMKVRDSK